MPSIKKKGKFGGPKNFQNSAVKTPRRASAPQHEGDDWLEDEKEEEQWQPDGLPDNP